MIPHEVRVHPSEDRLARADQLARRLAEVAATLARHAPTTARRRPDDGPGAFPPRRLPDFAPAELAGLSVTAVGLPAGDRAGIF